MWHHIDNIELPRPQAPGRPAQILVTPTSGSRGAAVAPLLGGQWSSQLSSGPLPRPLPSIFS